MHESHGGRAHPAADPVRIDGRFCGPPGTAHGGYLAGLLAEGRASPVQVTLLRPVPVDTDLGLHTEGDTAAVTANGRILAEAVPARLDLDVPDAPDFDAALEASARYIAFENHPFPRCFVCGPERPPGDGLRIFAGRVGDRRLVASAWTPGPALAADDGLIHAYFAWAALDCPGAFADLLDRKPIAQVLGRIVGVVRRRPEAAEPCVVIGWPIDRDGRKHHVGTAIVGSAGDVCAFARATWFDVRTGSGIGNREAGG